MGNVSCEVGNVRCGRVDTMKFGASWVAAVVLLGFFGATACADVEQWDIFELTLKGPGGGNPFVEVQLSAEFKQGGKVFEPSGFYDGAGEYKVRFMPNAAGKWTYFTKSNRKELDGKKGQITIASHSVFS